MLFVPCNLVGSDLSSAERPPIDPNCNPNLADQIEYVGQSIIKVLVNSAKFMPEGYGDESIFRYSTILNTQFDEHKPSWTTIDVVKADL